MAKRKKKHTQKRVLVAKNVTKKKKQERRMMKENLRKKIKLENTRTKSERSQYLFIYFFLNFFLL